jgi:hypothetical protein
MIVTDTFRMQKRNNTQRRKMKQRKTLSYSKNRENKRHHHRNIEVSFQEPKKGNKRRKEEWKKT